MNEALNEAETRLEYIDPALKAAGWGVTEGSRLRLEHLTKRIVKAFGADEGATQEQEGEMDVGSALVAHPQAPDGCPLGGVEPSKGALAAQRAPGPTMSP